MTRVSVKASWMAAQSSSLVTSTVPGAPRGGVVVWEEEREGGRSVGSVWELRVGRSVIRGLA